MDIVGRPVEDFTVHAREMPETIVDARMLHKKAKLITEAEARYIIAHGTAASSDWVVVQHTDQWFDIRGMTKTEITELIEDLDRKLAAELAAGIANPH
ncbi:MAG: hypothetical protein AB7G88_11645 [Thermomicrobiales bacterium]